MIICNQQYPAACITEQVYLVLAQLCVCVCVGGGGVYGGMCVCENCKTLSEELELKHVVTYRQTRSPLLLFITHIFLAVSRP